MDDKEDAEERIDNTVEASDAVSRAGRSSACRVAVGATPEGDEHDAITHGPTHASAVRSPQAGPLLQAAACRDFGRNAKG